LLSDIVHVDVAGLEEDGGYNCAALSVSLRVQAKINQKGAELIS